MITYQHHNRNVVRRLRIKGRKLDPLLARLRLDNLLQTVELHPAWLPPSAIVCLRQVRDPLPGALQLISHSPQRETQLVAWRQALSATVREESKRAVRPIKGQVSQDATAVIFNDRSELLACLAMDWLDHRLGSRWWWRSLIKGQVLPSVVSHEWSDSPEYVPAALELLAANRRIESFALALSPDQTKDLLREVTRSFALHELQSAIDQGFESISTGLSNDRVKARPFDGGSVHSNPTSAASLPPAPWNAFVSESLAQSMGLERQCLIGVALTIRRAPRAVRSSHFPRTTLSWLRAAGNVDFGRVRHSNASPQRHDALAEEDLRLNDESHLLSPIIGDATRESSSVEELNLQKEATRLSAEKELPLRAYEFSQLLSPSDVQMTKESASMPDVSDSATAPDVQTFHTSLPHQPSFDVARDLLTRDQIQVETEFGGIFYLINVGLFLELYSDFTSPHGNNFGLPIFDFIALIGRRLLNERITQDPVWSLLAQLSGRSEFDLPGHEFEPPDQWRLPAPWLEAFPDESTFEWNAEGERLRVRHSGNFMLLDVPLLDRPAEQLRREMMTYRSAAEPRLIRKSFSFSPNNNRLEQWLDWIEPYVRARLCRALGIDDASRLSQLLCARRASILLTAVHLDIFFELSEHPLEIRLAGLDRDPGWVPQAGRFIQFHYR